MKTSFLLVTLLVVASLAIPAFSDTPTLFRDPSVSRSRIAFAYAGDIWLVDRAGGKASRLTVGIGIESDPQFSPDGATVAFTGDYDGNADVFVVPVGGGVPRRLTYHPGDDRVEGWTRDGKAVLFGSSRYSVAGYSRLYTIATGGGLADALPLPFAAEGSFSPDGKRIAYQPQSQWQPDWKRYRGGQTGRIWIARLSDSEIETVPREDSNDIRPMWFEDTVYFLSDRAGSTTLHRYDTGSKQVSEAVPNDGLDIKSASAGPDAIVYERFGSIHLYEPDSGRSTKIDIEIEADLAGVRSRFASVGDRIANASISPNGVRAVFEARGEIITVPVKKGDPRNLTRSPGVMERDPAWSPDGKWIAYFSDASGEYALHMTDQKASGESRVVELGEPPTFYYSPVWSPDSKRIAYSDRRLSLWYVDIDNGDPVRIDTNPQGMAFSAGTLQPSWSPDSKWIAYARRLPNLLRAIFVHSVETGESHQITDGLSDAALPVFDRGGEYLYFAASTDVGPALSWADLSGINHESTRSVYAVVLSSEAPSPLAPESDEEEVASEDDEGTDDEEGEKTEGSDEDDESEDEESDEPEPVRIDLDGIDQRIIALPIPAGDYRQLAAAQAETLLVREAGGDGSVLHRFDFEEREFEQVLEGIGSIRVSANGEKMLFARGPQWTIAATEGKPDPGEGGLNTGAMQARVEPRSEWNQMFAEVWRGERDFFYDPNHHGLDLDAASRLYARYLDAVGHRSDLTYLFREMLNQLTIGHMFVGGGDSASADRVPGGLLGCDFELDDGRYRISRIYSGENWNPDLRAPLTEPGVDVRQGDYLLTVGGRDLTADDNVYRLFENTAGKQVVLRVSESGKDQDAREATVVPVASEATLRHRAWIDGNRRRVDEASGGKLAYVYLPNTSTRGYSSFNRYFFAQTDRQGAVIDERFNGGGLLADYVVNYLSRPQLSAIRFRYSEQDVAVPAGAIYGPKAMLINELAGSGGDAMPWYFRTMAIGPLIGTRTWGGLVAAQGGPRLMDGGFFTAPDAAVYGLSGEWEVENAGVPPDIEVIFDPAAWREGRDPQLERAIEYLLEALEKEPRTPPVRPEYPVYRRGNGLDK